MRFLLEQGLKWAEESSATALAIDQYGRQMLAEKKVEHAKKALTQAPDSLNKQSLEAMVKALESGQSFN